MNLGMHDGPLGSNRRRAALAVLAGAAPCATAAPAQPLAVAAAALTVACTAVALTALALLVCCLRARALARRCSRLALELGREQTRRAQAERAWRDSQAHLRRLATARAGAREAERRRIGRDIHDDLGQHLLALHLDIGNLHNSPRLPAWLRERTALIERHVRQTIGTLRTVIDDLRPAALQHGLSLAIRHHMDEFARRSGLRCELDIGAIGETAGAPPGAVETVLFRLLQEALSNVLRHAAAHTVHVTLRQECGQLVLTIRDDGIGLAPGCRSRGTGLSGMAERAAAAAGQLTLASRPGAGTTVSIALPAPPATSSRGRPARAEPSQAEYCG